MESKKQIGVSDKEEEESEDEDTSSSSSFEEESSVTSSSSDEVDVACLSEDEGSLDEVKDV